MSKCVDCGGIAEGGRSLTMGTPDDYPNPVYCERCARNRGYAPDYWDDPFYIAKMEELEREYMERANRDHARACLKRNDWDVKAALKELFPLSWRGLYQTWLRGSSIPASATIGR